MTATILQFNRPELDGAPAPVPTTPIAYGSSGSAVAALQTFLQSVGFSPGAIDGKYGNNTQAAVDALRRKLGVDVGGDWNQSIIDAVRADLSSSTSVLAQTSSLVIGTRQTTTTPTTTTAPPAPAGGSFLSSPWLWLGLGLVGVGVYFVKRNSKFTHLQRQTAGLEDEDEPDLEPDEDEDDEAEDDE